MLGCSGERYEVLETKDGRTVRLDKRTGQLATVVEGRLVPIQPLVFQEDSILSRTKHWPNDTLPIDKDSNVVASLTTKWVDGLLYYNFDIAPASAIAKNVSSSFGVERRFTLVFSDGDGFEVLRVPVPFSEIARRVGAKGKVEGLSASGSVSCPEEIYRRIAARNFRWQL
jgi:hypothetical protein